MKAFDFKVGDLLISHKGSIAVIQDFSVNMNGKKAFYLLFSKKNIGESLASAYVDYVLEMEIIAGKFEYYPIIT